MRDTLHYFSFTEKSYTPYFWSKAGFLFTHLLFGMTAFLLGPLQFFPQIRKKNVSIHRTVGKVYLVCIAVSSPMAFYLAITSTVNFVYAAGLAAMATIWAATSLMAYITIRKRLTTAHREWMVRSYVVTFAFATFRLFGDVFSYYGIGQDNNLAITFLSWASWSIPLFFQKLFSSCRNSAN